MKGGASWLALILVGALATAACGSGGKRQPAARTPATPSAPATPSTSSTGTGPTSTTGVPGLPHVKLPPSTPVSSSTYRDTYVKAAVAAGIPTSLAPQIVDCVIARLGGQGIATVGDIEPHQAQFVTDVRQCTKQAAGTR